MDQVIVVGAGLAGLAAARALRRAGASVLVLEARTRPGGRVLTVRDGATPCAIEGGPEFIHGRAPALLRLLREARTPPREIDEQSRVFAKGRLGDADDLWEGMQKLVSSFRDEKSVRAVLRGSAASRDVKQFTERYVQGFHAASLDRASARAIGDQERAAAKIEGDRAARVVEGLDVMIGTLARDLGEHVHLNARVTRIDWRRESVTVHARSGTGARLGPFHARRAIVTLPHAVLAARSVRFSPALPRDKVRAIDALETGNVVKVTLRFRKALWDPRVSFLHVPAAPFPVFWPPRPLDPPVLTGWAAGPHARRLEKLSELKILRAALRTLEGPLGTTRAQLEHLLEGWWIFDWSRDPFALGAYSWVPVGAQGAQAALAAPIDDTLFFAGEATHADGFSATLHGALETGERAAREVIARERRAPLRATHSSAGAHASDGASPRGGGRARARRGDGRGSG